MRWFSTLLAPIVALMVIAGPSDASEVSEVTIGPGRSPQPPTVTADAIEYAPYAPSELTLGPAASSPSETYRVAGTESYPSDSTVSEVTIQPGPFVPAAPSREAFATGESQPAGGVKPATKVALPKTKAR
jgi:hypothetical protein